MTGDLAAWLILIVALGSPIVLGMFENAKPTPHQPETPLVESAE